MDFIKDIVEKSRASIMKSDLSVLLHMLQPLHIEAVLEIGTWKGYSAEVWIKAFHPKTFVTIEKEPKPQDAIEIVSHHHKYFWETDSHSADLLINTGPYDFLFIDGDHSYEGVKKDWDLYSPSVREGGVVVFHDVVYTSDDPNAPVQVSRLWEELKPHHNYVEIKTDPHSTGMGILFV